MAVSTGAQWARIVGTWVYDQSDYVRSLNAAGVKVLLCLTRQSLNEANAWQYSERLGALISAVQCCNEPDAPPGSASSDTMSQDELLGYLRHVSAAFQAIPGVGLVGPGLSSGDPTWWNQKLWNACNMMAVHPYSKSPAEASLLLRQYHDMWGDDIWVTEFLDPGASLGLLPEYLAAFSALPFVRVAFSYGRSPAWAQGGGHVPEFQLGMLDYVAGTGQYAGHPHPECGIPLTDEVYSGPAISTQQTSTGILFYYGQSNAVTFLPKA